MIARKGLGLVQGEASRLDLATQVRRTHLTVFFFGFHWKRSLSSGGLGSVSFAERGLQVHLFAFESREGLMCFILEKRQWLL